MSTAHTRFPSPDAPVTTAGLLLSLAHQLERSNPLARSARQLAHRLNATAGHPSRALALAGADLLARLLDATDSDCADDDLLDDRFDD